MALLVIERTLAFILSSVIGGFRTEKGLDLLINQQNYFGSVQSKGCKQMREKANILVKKLWQTKVNYRVNVTPIKLQMEFFTELEKHLQFMKPQKKPRIAKVILSKKSKTKISHVLISNCITKLQ